MSAFFSLGDFKGNPCNENRDPVMRTGVSCNKKRFFPVIIDLQGLGFQCKKNNFDINWSQE